MPLRRALMQMLRKKLLLKRKLTKITHKQWW
jgi:hypothetical protein